MAQRNTAATHSPSENNSKMNEKLDLFEKWVLAEELGLDDQITYSYNLQSLKDIKRSPVVNATVPLSTPTATAAQTKDADD
eukprot:scaffold16512_cov69-Skeletonema_menzelii.AAC.1